MTISLRRRKAKVNTYLLLAVIFIILNKLTLIPGSNRVRLFEAKKR
jgi:hypothetical protein